MDSCDYVIVGSGPSGVAAALTLEGQGTCVLDVGEEPSSTFPFVSLREALDSGRVSELLGSRWEMLANLAWTGRCHPKLRAAAVKHATQGELFQVFGSEGELLVRGRGSYAVGGMANAWGAQLFRYTEADLSDVGGWPITISELERHYAELEAHIGISGQHDDMASFLGLSGELLPPVPTVPAADYLLGRYGKKRGSRRLAGLRLGRPRLAVLTRPHRGRAAYDFGETEFFSTGHEGLYTPRHSLAALRERGQINYLGRHKLVAFREYTEYVEIETEEVRSRQRKSLRTRHLLLGCGTIQTARLVLLSRGEAGRSLPFIDHPPTLLPVFFPARFGSQLPDRSFPIQLVGTLEGKGARDMISFYYPGGMLWSDLLPDIPLPIDAAYSVLGVLMGGMLVAQTWEPSHPAPGNRLRLESDGTVRIDYVERHPYSKLSILLSALRTLGGFSLRRLASMPPPTWGFHHAGTLPMRLDPGPFETHTDGRLWDSRRIRVIDGSVLPSLPAKNHSLTIMANAARIAKQVKRCGY